VRDATTEKRPYAAAGALLQAMSLTRCSSHYCRYSFIAHNGPPSRAERRTVGGPSMCSHAGQSGDDDGKSCWRSSTEYNSIYSRSSSPPPTLRDGVPTANAVITETDLFAYPLLRSGAAYAACHLHCVAR